MPSVPLTVGPGCDQPRNVIPLPDRLGVVAPLGDVLLTLTRRLGGKELDQIRTAQRFGLRRIGAQAIIRGTDMAAISAAYSIQDFVAITFLPGDYDVTPTRAPKDSSCRRIPGTSWYLPSDKVHKLRPTEIRIVRKAIRRGIASDSLPPGARTVGGLVKSKKLRDDFDLEGGYYEFAHEEYVHVEVDAHGAVVLWSAKLAADRAMEEVEDVLGRPHDHLPGFLVSVAGAGHDETSADVIDAAKVHPEDFRMCSVGYDNCIVSWRAPQVKMRGGNVAHVEMSFSTHRVDATALLELVRRTATPNLRDSLAKGGDDLIQSLVGPDRRGRRRLR